MRFGLLHGWQGCYHRIAACELQDRLPGALQDKNRDACRHMRPNSIFAPIMSDAINQITMRERGLFENQIGLDVMDKGRAGDMKMPRQTPTDNWVQGDLLGELRNRVNMLINEKVRRNGKAARTSQRGGNRCAQEADQGHDGDGSGCNIHGGLAFRRRRELDGTEAKQRNYGRRRLKRILVPRPDYTIIKRKINCHTNIM